MPSGNPLGVVAETSPAPASFVTAATSSVGSMMNQAIQVIATVEQDLISEVKMVGQEAAEEAFSVFEQLEHLLGVHRNASSPPQATALQTSIGSGAGSGTTAAHNGPEHHIAIALLQTGSDSGSGSGSGSGPTISFASEQYNVTEDPRYGSCDPNTVTISVELSVASNQSVSVDYETEDDSAFAGTDYIATSGTLTFAPGQTVQNFNVTILDDGTDEDAGTSQMFDATLSNPSGGNVPPDEHTVVTIVEGPPQQPTDTLVWNPMCGSTDASVATNWYDETTGYQLQKGDEGPNPSSPIVFDADPADTPYSNAPITWDKSVTVASITLNQYTNVQTVNADLTTSGYEDEDIGVSYFVVAFAAGDADLNFKAGQNVMGNFTWKAGGKITVNGANLAIGDAPGLNQSTASPLIINSGSVTIGATTTVGGTPGSSTFKLTNGSADINVNPNGTLKIVTPALQDTTMVDNTGTSAWIANYGTTQLVKLGGWRGTIAAPFENHGTLSAIDGDWKFTRADSNGNDLSMDVGKISMAKGVYLRLNDNYTQTGGTLELTDTTPGHLYASGQDNFDSGKIVFDSPSGFGGLYVGNVVFTGVEIDMRIDPGGTISDRISCLSGNKCVIQGTSKLVVTAAKAVNPGVAWTLIAPNKGQTITGDFNAANITLPNNVKEKAGALPNSWQCNS